METWEEQTIEVEIRGRLDLSLITTLLRTIKGLQELVETDSLFDRFN